MKRNESEWKQYRSKHLKTRMMTRLPGLAASRHQAQPPRVHFFMCRRPACSKCPQNKSLNVRTCTPILLYVSCPERVILRFAGSVPMPLPVPVSSLTAWNPTRTKAPETSHGSLYGCILTELPRKIILNTQLKTSYYEASNSGLIASLLTEMITIPKTSRRKRASRTSMDEKLDEILHYLQTHFTENITLEDLSEMFYISKYYLSREFKKKYGEGINSCINLFRINRGKELLRFTDKSIHEISEMCGIPDTNYFIKLFKSAENMTPSEYRQKWKG